MTSIAVGIVAHPSRQAMADKLARTVQADALSYDHHAAGERANHQSVIETLLEHDTDWVVLLEDDAVPCPDFRTHLVDALTHAPQGVVSLYLGTGRWAGTAPRHHQQVVRGLVEDADQEGARWITTTALWHAVGVAVRREQAASLLAHLHTSTTPTDEAITAWCRATHTPVHYTWPSLVDHHDGPTVTQHPDQQPRTQGRRAWRVHDGT